MQHPLAPGLELDDHGLVAKLQLGDGRWLCVSPLLYGRAQLAITRDVAPTVGEALALAEAGSYADLWHYDDVDGACLAMAAWATLDAFGYPTADQPRGWRRHPTAED